MGRGQSEVLAVVLLLGIVIVSAVAVVAVGSSALTAIEDQSSGEYDRNEMSSISHSITNTINSDGSFSLADVQNGYNVTDGANITVEVGNTTYGPYEIRRLQRNGLVYEGGMVIEDGRVVSSPDLTLTNDSTMISLPQLSGDQFGGELRQNGSTQISQSHIDEGIEVTLKSEYYEQWATQFSAVNATVTTPEDGTVKIRFNGTEDIDLPGPDTVDEAINLGMSDGSTFDLNSVPNTTISSYNEDTSDRHNAVVNTTVPSGNMGQGKGAFTIYGDMNSEGDIEMLRDHQQTEITGTVSSFEDIETPTSTTELMVDPRAPHYEAADGDIENRGIYYAKDLTYWGKQEVTVEEEAVLVVDGDLKLENADIIVEETLDVHVHGSLILEDGSEIRTADPHEAERISFFVEDDIVIRGTQGNGNKDSTGPTVTGFVHGSDSTLEMEGKFTVYGAMVMNAIKPDHHNHDELRFHYDERLEGSGVYATDIMSNDELFEFDGRVILGDANLSGEKYADNILITGDANINSYNLDGDLYVAGESTISSANLSGNVTTGGDITMSSVGVDGDVRVDGNVHATSEDIGGDLHATGWATIDGVGLNDVYTGNDLTITGASPDELHTGGELSIEQFGSESIYANGNVEVDRGTLDGDLHAGSDVTCNEVGISGDVHISPNGDATGCDDVTGDSGLVSPTEPTVPENFLPSLDDREPDPVTHYFELRLSEVKLE